MSGNVEDGCWVVVVSGVVDDEVCVPVLRSLATDASDASSDEYCAESVIKMVCARVVTKVDAG